MRDVHYEIRDGAARDLHKADDARRAKDRARRSRGQAAVVSSFRFRSRKDPRQSIQMRARHWGVGCYARIFSPTMRAAEALPGPGGLEHDGRLLRERAGGYRYYYILPVPMPMGGETQAANRTGTAPRIAAVDPGVRCFATIYDPTECAVLWWGGSDPSSPKKRIGDMARIYSLARKVDDLRSRCAKPDIRHRQRYKLNRRAELYRRRIRNAVDETHKKLAHHLCSSYDLVLLPEFRTSGMVSRRHRKIGSRTVRSMHTWAHYRFRMRLLSKAREFPSCTVVLCNEAYTSKTCGACGFLHEHLGGSRMFSCPCCKAEMDRDANGARNVLLKYVHDCGVALPC